MFSFARKIKRGAVRRTLALRHLEKVAISLSPETPMLQMDPAPPQWFSALHAYFSLALPKKVADFHCRA
jgi:hypothetical protein